MSGDYTRLTFRPERAYSSVRLQQGRVQVDADWNEVADIGLHLDRTTTRDTVGRTGVPEEAPGFALSPADPDGEGGGAALTDMLIGFGRAYVDGMLVENLPPAPTTLTPVAGSPGDFLVQSGPLPRLNQWLVDPADPNAPAARVTALTPPADQDARLRVTLQPVPGGANLLRLLAPSLRVQPDSEGDVVRRRRARTACISRPMSARSRRSTIGCCGRRRSVGRTPACAPRSSGGSAPRRAARAAATTRPAGAPIQRRGRGSSRRACRRSRPTIPA
jgi:Family of unknown function (DUF6519)